MKQGLAVDLCVNGIYVHAPIIGKTYDILRRKHLYISVVTEIIMFGHPRL